MSAAQLAFDYEPRKLARRKDPATSRAAASGDRTTNRARLLAAFAGHHGLTYVEAAAAAQMESHEAARRIADLTRLGLLEVATLGGREMLRETPNGRQARVHRITDAGKQVLRSQQK